MPRRGHEPSYTPLGAPLRPGVLVAVAPVARRQWETAQLSAQKRLSHEGSGNVYNEDSTYGTVAVEMGIEPRRVFLESIQSAGPHEQANRKLPAKPDSVLARAERFGHHALDRCPVWKTASISRRGLAALVAVEQRDARSR